jgi:hypothetical protein
MIRIATTTSFKLEGEKLFWKIDSYERARQAAMDRERFTNSQAARSVYPRTRQCRNCRVSGPFPAELVSSVRRFSHVGTSFSSGSVYREIGCEGPMPPIPASASPSALVAQKSIGPTRIIVFG